MIWLSITIVVILVALIVKNPRVSNILVVVAIAGFALTIVSHIIVTSMPTTHYKEIVEKEEERLLPINTYLAGGYPTQKEYFCATSNEGGYTKYFVSVEDEDDLLFINAQDCVFTTSEKPFVTVIRYTFENPIHYLLAFNPNNRVTIIGLPEGSFFTGYTISKLTLTGK